MFTLYAAILEVMKLKGIQAYYSMGLSLGEYGAMYHNNVFDFETGVKLLEQRGRFMQEASMNVDGKMSAILGMEDKALKELLEENRLELIDRATITELLTFVNKGNSYEAAKGYHDDMVMNCVLFAWFVTTEFFYHLTDSQVKDLLYSEQQKMIEDDMLPAGVFGSVKDENESFVDTEGDRWFVST